MRNYHFIFWRRFYEYAFRRNSSGENIIYMFHSIHDGITDPAVFQTNIDSFEKFLKNELKKRKASSLSYIVEGKCKGAFALSFDDVFENVYTNAYPLLKRYQIPFTLFVTTGLLDQPGYLTRNELMELSQDPLCTIGAHTIHHLRLRTAQNAAEEITESKKELEAMTGKKIAFFAYPYGSIYACSRKNIQQAENAGFTAAFSTIKGFVPLNFDRYRFFLPRNNGDDFVKFMEEKEEYD